MVIAGFTATALYLPNAYSDFSTNGKYLIDASGYLSGNKTIFDSNIALQITAGAKSGSNMQATIDNGLVTISGAHYLNSGLWQISILRDGKYFVIQGDAQDENGNIIHLNLFGRIINSNQDGSVFSISGKITSSETLKVSYSSKIISANTVTTIPTTNTTSTQQPSSSTKVSISIVSGASSVNNQVHYSPSNIQVTPGTTIVWTNNDSVPHRIMSGQLLSTTDSTGGKGSTGKPVSPHFVSDNNIDSGDIAPGQHYQITFTNTGTTQIFDPTYTWINGIIISSTATTGQIAPITISINPGSSLQKGSATQQTYNQYNTYYTPETIQIVPGTPIIWVNNDSIEHTILSGTSTQQYATNPFKPDGKIASGKIAPGQTFTVIVNDTGIVRFYDPQYTWMNGLIISMPPTQSYTIGASSHNSALH